MGVSAWEAIFMLVVLKIPIVYLGIVVWWAVRAEPRPLEGAGAPGPGPTRTARTTVGSRVARAVVVRTAWDARARIPAPRGSGAR